MKNVFSPNVRRIDEITYEFPQSKYEIASKSPIYRNHYPTARFRKIWITDEYIKLDVYKNVFSRIYMGRLLEMLTVYGYQSRNAQRRYEGWYG